jgi:hypothetical protein
MERKSAHGRRIVKPISESEEGDADGHFQCCRGLIAFSVAQCVLVTACGRGHSRFSG